MRFNANVNLSHNSIILAISAFADSLSPLVPLNLKTCYNITVMDSKKEYGVEK